MKKHQTASLLLSLLCTLFIDYKLC